VFDQGYEYEDCVGYCFNDDSCTGGTNSCLDWVGDGYCDDGTWGLNLNCEEWDFDGGDCEETNCDSGYVDDCAGDGDCCPESWIGDGFADCEDQTWGCDLTCYNNDGGDCGGRQENNSNGSKILSYIEFLNGKGYDHYSFNSSPVVNSTKSINPGASTGSRDYILITSTSSTDYMDTDVINGTEYCYYTTAVNEAGESDASDIVCATPESDEPAADVLLDIGDLEINVGEMGGLALAMENEDPVAGFQFELSSTVDVVEIINIQTTDRTEGFTCSTANNIVICFSLTGDVIESGNGAYLVVEVAGTTAGNTDICYDDVILSDPYGVAMPYNTSCGSITVNDVSVDPVVMSVGDGSTTQGNMGTVDVSADTTLAISGSIER
jgi:hypothetical protein